MSVQAHSGLATIQEASEALGVSQKAVRRWVADRRLPAVRVGRCVRIRRTDLARVIANGLAAVEPARQRRLGHR
jgi:excisionase family DNA binding protein